MTPRETSRDPASEPSIATGLALRVAELFLSLQGEGPSAGTPAHFLRLQGCDVGCHWCDTKYTWDASGGRELSLAGTFAALRELGEAPLLVVTGGEPLTHPGIERVLAAAVGRWPRVEVETSGIAPLVFTHERLHHMWSPKLPGVTERWQETWAHAARFVADPRTWVKLVLSEGDDATALRLIREHALPRERVMLMPQGLTDAALRERALSLAELCKRQGLRLSPRLHVWLWGAKKGV